jgi:DNA-binding XRE family transcriptional regulator
MSKVGRPTKYKAEYADQAYKLTLLGATDAQLADFFGVTEQTFNAWKKSHPEFLESITRGKDLADAEIAAALYHRAKGYTHPEDKIFNNNGQEMVVPTIKHYPPDTQAASLWLRNRQPGRWRDKQQVEHSVDNDLVRRILDARQRNQ